MRARIQRYPFLLYWAMSNVLLFGFTVLSFYFALLGPIVFLIALLVPGYLMAKTQVMLIEKHLDWELPDWEARTREGSRFGTMLAFSIFILWFLVLEQWLLETNAFISRSSIFLLGFLPYISFRVLTAFIQSSALPIAKPLSWVLVNLEGGCLASGLVYLAWISHQSLPVLVLSLILGISLCAMLTGSSLIRMRSESDISSKQTSNNTEKALQGR